MASLGELGGLSSAEYADLNDRVDRFHAAWRPDGSVPVEAFVPPPGARHRLTVIGELIRTDMELRVKAGLPIRVETYLSRFPDELLAEAVPLSLLAEEYSLRHRHGDKPDISEYHRRFPAQFDALVRRLAMPTEGPPAPPPADPSKRGTVGLDSLPGQDNTPLGPASPTKVSPTPPRPRSGPPKSSSGLGSISASDILPAGLKYELLRRLGEGAFGEVFEALAPGGFRVAVKRIRRNVDHPASQGELEAIEAIKNLRHVYLLQTQNAWVLEDRLVLVMDLAEGSLADQIKHHKSRGAMGVPPEELIPFFEQAADALDYLHSQNVSHRDVKPENLLVLKGYAQVADFGLARLHEHELTVIDMAVGTPAYMAPEVCLGKVSLHSDQYSLAATYVAARLGRYLFNTKNRREMEDHHLRTIPNLDPLPPAEQRVLHKALAKRPEDRYPSCAAFTRALRNAVIEPPPPPPPPGRRLFIALAALATLVCVVMATVIYWLLTRPDPPPPPPNGPVGEWCPPGWDPNPEAGTEPVGQKHYWKELTCTFAGEQLVARLVYPTDPRDPPPFYMLKNKITNRVFEAAWAKAGEPGAPLERFRREIDPRDLKLLLPQRWRKPVRDGRGPDVPVVGVTFPEAVLVAEQLRGNVPTYEQWLKAVGMRDRGAGGLAGDSPGPAGPAVEGNDDERRTAIEGRGLALGLPTGPWPVSRETPDLSCFGIHQLVTNGEEWVDQHRIKFELDWKIGRLKLDPNDIKKPFMVRVVGTDWVVLRVLTFDQISGDEKSVDWVSGDTKRGWDGDSVGFRIVLEPPQ
jgi:serine/threonine protein kinase